jgi:putative membrane protein
MANRMRANVHEIRGVKLHEEIRILADVPYSVVC